MSDQNKWKGSPVAPEVLEAANYLVQRVANGNYAAGRRLVVECSDAVREIVETGTLPDAERQLYLSALLQSLDAIAKGADPAKAMGLDKPANRPEDPLRYSRDLSIFVFIGRHYDEFIATGQTKADKPLAQALTLAAKLFQIEQTTTQKVWSEYGSLKGWNKFKSDLK